ncbi:MAG: zinc ribbon domain-containing protein [Thermoleophilia bacterium]
MLIKVLLALTVVGFVGYPLVRGLQASVDDEPEISEELEELYRRKESTYSALKELEFDYKTGKLSEGDFQELDARYRGDALDILEALDLTERGAPATAPRRRGGAKKRPRPESAQPALQAGECAACGRLNPENARFCASCGVTLEDMGAVADGEAHSVDENEDDDALACHECGREVEPGHRFCAGCGAEVGS